MSDEDKMRISRNTGLKAICSTGRLLLILLLAIGLNPQLSKAQSEETTDTNQTDNETEDEIVQLTRINSAMGAGQGSTEPPSSQETVDINTVNNLDTTLEVESQSTTPPTSEPVTNLVVASTGTTQAPIVVETTEELPPEHENIGHAIASMLSQQQTTTRSPNNEFRPRPSPVWESDDTDLEDPLSIRLAALSSLNNITSLDDLLATGLVVKDGHVATRADYNARVDSSGKMYISGSDARAEMPASDECGPRKTTVRLNITNVDASILVYPRCIRELRCGGCCRVPNVACVSIYNETQLFNLLQLRPYTRRGDVHLESVGYLTLRVERHTRCQCRCTLTRDSCGPRKILMRHQCRCECRERLRCRSPSIFNEETCDCECPKHLRDSCTGRLDPNTCNCGRSYISASNSGSQQQVEDNLTETESNSLTSQEGVAMISDTPSPSTTSSTAAPTTPTTQTASTPSTPAPPTSTAAGRSSANACPTLRCPPNHEPFRSSSGTCSCRPRNRGPVRGRNTGRGAWGRGARTRVRFGQRTRSRFQPRV